MGSRREKVGKPLSGSIMNILLINHYAGSNKHGMGLRPFYLAREWVKLGHNVSIISSASSHLLIQEPEINGDITEEYIEGIRYIWVKTPEYRGNGARRVFNMGVFVWQLLRYKSELAKKTTPDVVIASSPHPFVILGARKIAQYTCAKLIFEVRDIWPLSLIELGNISPKHPFIRVMQWVENYAYRISDYVISLLPKADIHMREHGMEPHKFLYLPNGIDVEEWQKCGTALPKHHSEVLENLREKSQFLVGYTGAHGLANALQYVIDAAQILERHQVTLVLVGKGPEKSALQEKAKSMGLTNIVFLPPVTRGAMPALLQQMDAVFIGWNKKRLYQFGVSPNKLMDYMMSAKPVIHAIEAANDLVSESCCGLSIPPEDPKAIAEAIIELMDMPQEKRDQMGQNGREYVLTKHDYRILAKKSIEWLQK